MTKLIREIYNIEPIQKGSVVTIGNFDGVHLGHKALISKVKERAQALHVPSMVITFEPQPAEYFAKFSKGEKEAAPSKGRILPPAARLTRWREKYYWLAETSIDYVLVLQFNHKLAELTAEDFVKQILVDALAVEHIIVGDDFRFGHNRQGDFNLLVKLGEDFGFTVENIHSLVIEGERASSTRIRQALSVGNHAVAELLLGRPYTMMGRVVHGDKLGRKLGFPTANIYLHRAVTPVQGIYVVRMHGIEKHGLPGVANVGIRPTVGGTRSLLEVYLFDFDRDIYGRHVTVEFCKKLRDEKHYENLDLLRKAIAEDVVQARSYFEERGEL